MEAEIKSLRQSLKKAQEQTKQMKEINKELLDQLNLKQRSGASPRTRVTDGSEDQPTTTEYNNNNKAAVGSIINEDSILDVGSSINAEPAASGGADLANTAKASFFRNRSSHRDINNSK